jgi:hypothetical protein
MQLFEEIKSLAKQVLIRDGYHAQMVLIFPPNNQIMPVLLNWKTDEEKWELFHKVHQLLNELHSDHYIMIMESFARTIKPEQLKYIKENYDTERPSIYPESMRMEMLVIHEQYRNGTGNLCCIEFKKVDEKVEILNEINEPISAEAKIVGTNFFKDS